MTWEYWLAGGAALFLAFCGLVFIAVLIYAVARSGKPGKTVVDSFRANAPTTLVSAMELIDGTAKVTAYERVSDKITNHRAGRYEGELLDALSPPAEVAAAPKAARAKAAPKAAATKAAAKK